MEKRIKKKTATFTGDTEQTPKTKKQLLTQIIRKQTKEKFLTENQRIYYDILKSSKIRIEMKCVKMLIHTKNENFN